MSVDRATWRARLELIVAAIVLVRRSCGFYGTANATPTIAPPHCQQWRRKVTIEDFKTRYRDQALPRICTEADQPTASLSIAPVMRSFDRFWPALISRHIGVNVMKWLRIGELRIASRATTNRGLVQCPYLDHHKVGKRWNARQYMCSAARAEFPRSRQVHSGSLKPCGATFGVGQTGRAETDDDVGVPAADVLAFAAIAL